MLVFSLCNCEVVLQYSLTYAFIHMYYQLPVVSYRIAGKFRGQKFSRLTSLKTFRELNLEDQLDYHCICILE